MPRPYDQIEAAVESAVSYGWRRAHKHVENPEEEHILQAISSAVMNEMYDVIDGLAYQLAVEKLVADLKEP